MMNPTDGEHYDAMVRDLADAKAEIERLRTELAAIAAKCTQLKDDHEYNALLVVEARMRCDHFTAAAKHFWHERDLLLEQNNRLWAERDC